eukprot:scaffold823_cov219-Amphora_coffeaeformis.AAC.7
MMFIWETLSNWLDILWQSLGLTGKEGSVVLLGLDNAGKTTLLHRLRTGRVQQHAFPPTDRPSAAANRFKYQGVSFASWDLGGHEVVRHLWADYVASEQESNSNRMAILFLIDAADHERIEEAGYELDHLIHETLLVGDNDNTEDAADENNNAVSQTSSTLPPPLAIFLNKCDTETAATTEEICQRIDWNGLQESYPADRIKIFRGSVWKEEGYPEAFRFMASFF